MRNLLVARKPVGGKIGAWPDIAERLHLMLPSGVA
jgi:hypothetical protein